MVRVFGNLTLPNLGIFPGFLEKKICIERYSVEIKKKGLPTLPKILRPVTLTTGIFIAFEKGGGVYWIWVVSHSVIILFPLNILRTN